MPVSTIFPNLFYISCDTKYSDLSSIENDYVVNFKERIYPNFIDGLSSGKFNSEWNEAYGNALASLSALCLITNDHDLKYKSKNLFDKIVDVETFSIYGGEVDEMNVAHLVVGVVCFVEYLEYKKINYTLDKVINLFEKTLLRSLANEVSNWYCEKVYLHNHCFWLLLMRIILCKFLINNNHASSTTKDVYEQSILRFESNLEFLSRVGDGSFYEGASYGTYVATAVSIFLIFTHHNYGSRKYLNNTWLRNFSNFISHSYHANSYFAYSVGDSTINWTSGPEHQIKIFHSYCKLPVDEVLLSKIDLLRANTFPSLFYNRSVQEFINLNYASIIFSGEADFLPVSKNIEIIRFEDSGVCVISSGDSKLFINYGTYGGNLIKYIPDHNIGHSYPSIGGCAYANGSMTYLSGALYQKPKLSEYHPVPIFLKNGTAYGQIGSSDNLLQKSSWLKVDNFTYPYSPLYHIRESEFYSIFCLPVNNYTLPSIIFTRYYIYSNEINGVFLVDVFYNKSADVCSAVLNYPMVLRDRTSINNLMIESDYYLRILEADLKPEIEITDLDCHGDSYALINRKVSIQLSGYDLTCLCAFVGKGNFKHASASIFNKILHIEVVCDNFAIDEYFSLIDF